jgi:hypothetical protein
MFREFVNNRSIGLISIWVIDPKWRSWVQLCPRVFPTRDSLIAVMPRRKRSRVLKAAEKPPLSVLPGIKRPIVID